MHIHFDPASKAHLALFSEQSQQAIARTLHSLLQGFKQRDARMLKDVYRHDADWVNAFGTRRRGAEDIVSYLHGLFADANFNEGNLVDEPEINLRVLSEDIVVVTGHLRIRGQRLLDGGVIDERDNHSIRILQRQADGRWLIVSEMYMDANKEPSYAAHS